MASVAGPGAMGFPWRGFVVFFLERFDEEFGVGGGFCAVGGGVVKSSRGS